MEISVIISNSEKETDLIPCVEAIIKQEYDFSYEIILIDNFTKNDSLRKLEHMPFKLLIKENKNGWFSSLKLAIEHSTYDVLAFTDSHCIVTKDWLINIKRVFRTQKILSGRVNHGKTFQQKFSQLLTHFEFSAMDQKHIQNIFDGNFVVRKDFLKTMMSGLPVDENVSDGAGAVLLAKTVIRNNYVINHEPKIEVFHKSENFNESIEQWFSVFGPNSIIIRKLNPEARGAKLLKLGLFASLIFAMARWISLTRKLITSWKDFGLQLSELPGTFLWYNVCVGAYFLGMIRHLLPGRISPQGIVKRQFKKIDLKRFYKEILYTFRLAYRPLRINIAITDQCNLRCPTCSKWKGTSKKRELTAEEWGEVLKKIKGLSISSQLTISGGELFSRNDIFDILGAANSASWGVIIISNGTLIDQTKVELLKNYRIKQIILSINGINSETHDPTRGLSGSFEKTIRSLELIANHNIPVVIETIILKSNLNELTDLVNLTEQKNLKGITFQVLTASNVHNLFLENVDRMPAEMWYKRDPEWIDDIDKLTEIVDKLIEMKKSGKPIENSIKQLKYFPIYYREQRKIQKLHCLSGSSFMIDPYGDVRLCYSFQPIGNVLKQSPKEIWRSSNAKATRMRIRSCHAACRLLNNVW